jgi:hypothetical protein
LLAGRLLWRLIARANGLAMGAIIPGGFVLLIAGLAFAVPIALIALPAWLVARRNAAAMLRIE